MSVIAYGVTPFVAREHSTFSAFAQEVRLRTETLTGVVQVAENLGSQ